MKLLVFTPFPERLGGSDNILWNYLKHADRSRVEPVVVFRGDGPFREEVARLGIRTNVIPAGRLRQGHRAVAGVWRLAQTIRREAPDLVLNWLSTAHVYGAPAAVLARAADRTIWWQLDLDRGGPLDRVRVMTNLAGRLPAFAVGACSETIAAAERARRPDRKAIAVLPGIDPPALSAEEVEEARRASRLPADAFVVGIVGRLFPWKGQASVLRATRILRDAGVPAHALIVGGGAHRADLDYERSLRDLATELEIASSVSFTGQVPDAGPYISQMDAFVNASRAEPFGLVVLEAMAAGVPVVAVDAAGPREILTSGKTGLLVKSSSPSDIASALSTLWHDEAGRRRIGAAGRARYQERFTALASAQHMDDALIGLAREMAR